MLVKLGKGRIQLASLNTESILQSVKCWSQLSRTDSLRGAAEFSQQQNPLRNSVSPRKECIPRKSIRASKPQRNSLKPKNYVSYSLLLFLAHWLPPTILLSFLPPLQASNPSPSNHFLLHWVLHNPAEPAALLLTRRKQLLALLHHAVAAPATEPGEAELHFPACPVVICWL